MQRIIVRVFWGVLLALVGRANAAQSLPVGFFARAPAIEDVHLSGDGQYLLYRTAQSGNATLNVVDRQTAHTAAVSFGDAKEIEVAWCSWVRNRRIVCGLRRVSGWEHPGEITRLVGVDADGTHLKLLLDNGFGPVNVANQLVSLGAQASDSIVVQMAPFPSRSPFRESPSPFDLVRLNVYTGAIERLAAATRTMPAATDFFANSDASRLVARGILSDNVVFWTRTAEEVRWRELFRFRAPEHAPRAVPFAISPTSQWAYAQGDGEHHRALFRFDFNDMHKDALLYESPDADILAPIYAGDETMIGVTMDSDQPSAHYFESRDAAVVSSANRLLPDRFNQIVDVTPNKQVYLLRSSSDAGPAAYYLLDTRDSDRKFELVGSEYPELARVALPKTQIIHLPARDGSSERALLTVPLDEHAGPRPTVIMTDDGPAGRARWEFNFLRGFLVSRGFAVLQLQLNEASSARQNTARNNLNSTGYDAIANVAQWAIEQHIADPERIALMGWGYGGYLALLGAQRNPDLFHCAVAVNAISDLTEWPASEQLVREDVSWISGPSPRAEARRTASPVLIVNGAHDAVVHPHHSVRLIRSYQVNGVTYEHLEIRDGTYELQEQTGRAQVLNRVEQFLKTKLQVTDPTDRSALPHRLKE